MRRAPPDRPILAATFDHNWSDLLSVTGARRVSSELIHSMEKLFRGCAKTTLPSVKFCGFEFLVVPLVSRCDCVNFVGFAKRVKKAPSDSKLTIAAAILKKKGNPQNFTLESMPTGNL